MPSLLDTAVAGVLAAETAINSDRATSATSQSIADGATAAAKTASDTAAATLVTAQANSASVLAAGQALDATDIASFNAACVAVSEAALASVIPTPSAPASPSAPAADAAPVDAPATA